MEAAAHLLLPPKGTELVENLTSLHALMLVEAAQQASALGRSATSSSSQASAGPGAPAGAGAGVGAAAVAATGAGAAAAAAATAAAAAELGRRLQERKRSLMSAGPLKPPQLRGSWTEVANQLSWALHIRRLWTAATLL